MKKNRLYAFWVGELFALFLFFLSTPVNAQNNVAINDIGLAPHPSAMLDVSGTYGGVLMPRMTEAEKLAIASPVNGLTIWQTDGGVGYWYYDGVNNTWRMLSRYVAGEVEMGEEPSEITRGTGYTVTRLATGVDQINFTLPFSEPPSVVLSSDYGPGSAPVLTDYCTPSYTSCNNVQVLNFWLHHSVNIGTASAPNNVLIANEASGCNGLPGSYIYYPPGDPVYVEPVPDLCMGVDPEVFRMRARVLHSTANALIRVWIDWGQDGFHDGMDDLVWESNSLSWPGNLATGAAGELIAPASYPAFSGNTLMRVTAAVNPPANSCPGGSNGETEEYMIHISCRPDPVYQDIPIYCNIGEITPNSFRVACRRVNGEPRNARKYFFQVHENN